MQKVRVIVGIGNDKALSKMLYDLNPTPRLINKIVNKTEDFKFVWKKLISKKKLIVSDVKPKKWFTIDSVKQLTIFKKKNYQNV